MCNVTMSRRVTHIVPTRSDVTQIFGANLAPNWVVLLPVTARLMLVLREKFILGNYICIRLKYPDTLFVGTSAGDQEMDGDTGERGLVSTHAMLITLSLTNTRHTMSQGPTLTQIYFKNTNLFSNFSLNKFGIWIWMLVVTLESLHQRGSEARNERRNNCG